MPQSNQMKFPILINKCLIIKLNMIFKKNHSSVIIFSRFQFLLKGTFLFDSLKHVLKTIFYMYVFEVSVVGSDRS